MRMAKSILLFLFFTHIYCFSSQTIPITIFIHGTRGLSKLFVEYTNQDNKIIPITTIPRSCITHSISNVLSEANSDRFSKKYFYVFGWSGILSHQARLEAAKILYSQLSGLVEKFTQEHIHLEITLIAHSHGGNVALNMVNYIDKNADITFHINNLILLACPVQEQTRSLVNHGFFKNIYNIFSNLDLTQILDPQGLHPENRHKKVPFFSGRKFDFLPKLKQVNIKINDYGVTHAGFLSPKFFKHLPNVLDRMNTLPSSDSVFLLQL
jgi:hypothetical protein